MNWIKASERLPDTTASIIFRIDNSVNCVGSFFKKGSSDAVVTDRFYSRSSKNNYHINDFHRIEWLDESTPPASVEEAAYWRHRCKLAETVIEASPSDPDITSEQIKAHQAYKDFLAGSPLPDTPIRNDSCAQLSTEQQSQEIKELREGLDKAKWALEYFSNHDWRSEACDPHAVILKSAIDILLNKHTK